MALLESQLTDNVEKNYPFITFLRNKPKKDTKGIPDYTMLLSKDYLKDGVEQNGDTSCFIEFKACEDIPEFYSELRKDGRHLQAVYLYDYYKDSTIINYNPVRNIVEEFIVLKESGFYKFKLVSETNFDKPVIQRFELLRKYID